MKLNANRLFICEEGVSRVFRYFNNTLGVLEHFVGGVFLILTTLLAFAQVVNRYCLHLQIMGIGDLALYCYVITLFSTLALTTKENGHTAVEMLQRKLVGNNPRANRRYNVGKYIISLMVLLLFLGPLWNFFTDAMKYPEYGILIRWFNMSWLVYILFAAWVLAIYHIGMRIVLEFSHVEE